MNLTKKRITRKDIFENKITQENSVIEIINLDSKYYKVIKQVEIDNYYLLDNILLPQVVDVKLVVIRVIKYILKKQFIR